jgi:hypothetical protein
MKRRFLLTKDEVCIAFVDEETLRDKIPLAEIETIEKMDLDTFKETSIDANPRSMSLRTSIFSSRTEDCSAHTGSSVRVIKVSTNSVGYNSGRIYYFQPESENGSEFLMDEFLKYVEIARKKAEGKTRFQKSQEDVRKFINSRPSSIATGLVLITVGSLKHNSLLLVPSHMMSLPRFAHRATGH